MAVVTIDSDYLAQYYFDTANGVYVKTQIGLATLMSIGRVYTRYYRAGVRFPLSALPQGATVTAVTLTVNCVTQNDANFNWQVSNNGGVTNDPAADAAVAGFNNATGATYLGATGMGAGFHVVSLLAQAVTDLNAQLVAARNYFVLGLSATTEASLFYANLDSTLSLTITYTPPSLSPAVVAPPYDTVVIASQPSITGLYRHPTAQAGDKWQVEVYADNGTTLLHASGDIIVGLTDNTQMFYTLPTPLSTGPALLTPGTYYRYRMRSHSATDLLWSNWSDINLTRFRIDQGPSAPSALAPSGGQGVNSLTPVLTWDYTHPQLVAESDAFVEVRRNSDDVLMNTHYTALEYDDFNRVDGALGASLTGQTWANLTGTIQIVSNVAKATAVVGAAALANCGDSGQAAVIIAAKVSFVGVDRAGIAFNIVDANNYWRFTLFLSGGLASWALEKVVAGVITTSASGQSPSTLTTQLIKVSTQQGAINCYINEQKVASVNDSFNQAATKHGVFFSSIVAGLTIDEWFVTLPANATVSWVYNPTGGSALVPATTYKWRVKVRDGYIWSALANYATFIPATPNTVTITSPIEAAQVGTPTPTITWTAAGGGAQAKFRVVLYDATGLVVYDSGYVISVVTTFQIPTGKLNNVSTYTMKVTVVDGSNVEGTSALRTFTTLWTPPATPTGLASTPGNDTVTFAWNISTDPDFIGYDLYNAPGGAGQRIARVTTIGQGSLLYYFPELSVLARYSMRVVKSLSGQEIPSLAANFPAFTCVPSPPLTIVSVAQPSSTVLAPTSMSLLYMPEKIIQRAQDFKDVMYWGRRKPVRHFGTQDYTKIQVRFLLDQLTAGTIESLQAYEGVLCLRDSRGRKWFVYLDPYSINDVHPSQSEVSMNFVETEYTET